MDKSNFIFLKDKYKELYEIGKDIEQSVYLKPGIAIFKERQYLEALFDLILVEKAELKVNNSTNLSTCISQLKCKVYREKIHIDGLGKEDIEKMYEVKDFGNKTVHRVPLSNESVIAERNLEFLYSLTKRLVRNELNLDSEVKIDKELLESKLNDKNLQAIQNLQNNFNQIIKKDEEKEKIEQKRQEKLESQIAEMANNHSSFFRKQLFLFAFLLLFTVVGFGINSFQKSMNADTQSLTISSETTANQETQSSVQFSSESKPLYKKKSSQASGIIVDVRSAKGYTFIDLDTRDESLTIPIFDKSVFPEVEYFSVGDTLYVTGDRQVYKGQEQIIPQKKGDLILGE